MNKEEHLRSQHNINKKGKQKKKRLLRKWRVSVVGSEWGKLQE